MTAIAFLDVAYGTDAAGVACVIADSWQADRAIATAADRIPGAPVPYEPGEFYRRELPLLLALLRGLGPSPGIFVIDGYVWLGEDVPGLGAHLFEAYGAAVPVIGVAKSRYQGDTWSVPVLRGTSRRPLHVTAAGMELSEAADRVQRMHGTHRIPTLLQEVDRLARTALRLT